MEPSDDFGDGPRTKALRPGVYRVYLITDEEAEVTLRLRGARGEVEMEADHSSPADMKPLHPNVAVEDGRSIWAAGNDYHMGDHGFVLVNLFLSAKEFKGIELGACLYSFPTAPPREISYGPHCNVLMETGLVGGYSLSSPPALTGPGQKASLHLTVLFDYSEGVLPNIDDRHGGGLWYATTGAIDYATAQFAYVTF